MNEPIPRGHEIARPGRESLPGSRCRRVRAAAMLAAALLLLGGIPVAGAGEPAPSAPTPSEPTDAERVSYWLNRLVNGPEPTAFPIDGLKFQKESLDDAERNLVALGDVTLEHLADSALIERLQHQEDANPWHAILSVLTRLAPRRPEVARAWAVPALRHDLLTLRRYAIVVFEAMHSPADGPVLVEALAKNGDDRQLTPRLAGLLLRFGAPYDGEAARILYARAVGDRPDGSSGLWTDLAAVASDTPDGARPDLLAWWGLLSETTGPRALDPVRMGVATSRSIDPARLFVVASPHALTSGRAAAAEARFALARQGNATAARHVELELASADSVVRDVARRFHERPVTTADREGVRAKAAAFVAALRGSSPPTPEEVAAVARALRSDESPEALRQLEELFRTTPKMRTWKVALLDEFDGLVVRGGALEDAMRALLADGSDDAVDLAFLLMLRSPGRAYVRVIEEWLPTPAASARRFRARRDLAFMYVYLFEHGELDPIEVGTFVKTLGVWVEDPDDPSGAGLVSVLLDLGTSGEAVLAQGLAGPRRDLYVAGLSGASRYVARNVLAALLAPVERRTPTEERRRLLELAFRTASASAVDVLEALAGRLSDEGRADTETVLQIVRHRARSR